MPGLGLIEAEASAPELRDGPASPWEPLQVTVSVALFGRFQQLIYRESGIWLSESKTALLCGRLSRRLRALQLRTLSEYYELIIQPDQREERILMIDAITTNETRFFREPKHFEYLATTVFPQWRMRAERRLRSKKIRIWSAGCSTGEEAYSLAMLLTKHFPASEAWDLRVLATDISTHVLATARAAIYRIASYTDIPPDMLQQFMLKGHDEHEGEMKVSREIRQVVDFKRLNLGQDSYPVSESFDVIFCRNVLIYFDTAGKARVVEKLMRHLAPRGLFFIGHAENLQSLTRGFRSAAPTVYMQKNEKSEPREKA